ncbi:c-type cytochrome biogenesis protein CcmI [Metarhizobium album]|uniref:C-type cytochrome biogenesis protein CcmI n=1 Tax=Metarhizobium album TaxID=2182425 RepID=A0A2U2DY02_9HYPH|nr:c-type cytochrome biogenesis protein CcmI [Rhizobium album]PWE58198.1 c-type cytochrome biogenesis protein CcmI [Rhizobium album]
MLFWIIVAILTAAVAIVLLLPLLRGAKERLSDRAGEAAVYRDQLKELERDQAQGLITPDEAEYARAEVGRRLIAVSSGMEKQVARGSGLRRIRLAEIVVVVTLPAVGLCLYSITGSPELPSQPLEARLANPGNDMGILVTKAERHLAQNPEDGQGWDLLAPIYYRSLRLGDAELAYRNAIRLLGGNAERWNGLGETLIAAADGIVTDDARAAFEEALKLDGSNFRTKFYLALALEQTGKQAEAKAAFETLAKESPADAPWIPLVNEHIAKNGGAPLATAGAEKPLGNPTAEDVAAAENLEAGDRQQMIEGMVASLDAKLREDPKNIEGWMRLIRSYGVLKQPDKAADALKRGLAVFPADSAEGKQMLALAQGMGIATEGNEQ